MSAIAHNFRTQRICQPKGTYATRPPSLRPLPPRPGGCPLRSLATLRRLHHRNDALADCLGQIIPSLDHTGQFRVVLGKQRGKLFLTVFVRFWYTIACGDRGTVLKTVRGREVSRGFESHPLRQCCVGRFVGQEMTEGDVR